MELKRLHTCFKIKEIGCKKIPYGVCFVIVLVYALELMVSPLLALDFTLLLPVDDMAKQMMIAAMPTAANTIFLLEKEEAYDFRGLLTLAQSGFIL